MKRLVALATIAAFALASTLAATAASEDNSTNHHTPPPLSCTVQAFRPFSAKVWDPAHWQRGKPKHSTVQAQRRRLACASPGHRIAMQQTWRRDQEAFYAHRRAELWRIRVTPFWGGGNWWALPYPMVICESSANYTQPYGAYSILDPAWQEWGGRTAHAGEASEREQDLVAHRGWRIYGESAWECKGDGHPHSF